MPMVFPTSPTVGQVFSSGGRSWVWTGSTWDSPRSDNPPLAIPQGNVIINGAFDIWQRGTSFSNPATGTYSADRFATDTAGSGTTSVSQQTFTPGELSSLGFGDARHYLRMNTSSVGTLTAFYLYQNIEDVRTLAGQVVTLSFWGRASSTRSVALQFGQNFGAGGSGFLGGLGATSVQVGTTWQRFSMTTTLPSISGRTIGANSVLTSYIIPNIASGTLDIWGFQVEAGAVATPFKRNAPSLQGELAACQRYYFRTTSQLSTYANFSYGIANSAGNCRVSVTPPTEMRVKPTSVDFANLSLFDGVSFFAVTGVSLDPGINTPRLAYIDCGASGLTTYRSYFLIANNTANAFLGFSAEL